MASNFFDTIIDAGEGLISGLGDSFEATGIADKAKAESILINAQIVAAEAKARNDRKERQLQLVENVTYISLAAILVTVVSVYVVLPAIKK